MKESAKRRTGARSAKGKPATAPSTPVREDPVLVITKTIEYGDAEDYEFTLHVRDVVGMEPYVWDDKIDVRYRTVGGATAEIRIGPGDVYTAGGKKICYERVKMLLDNRMNEVGIDELPG